MLILPITFPSESVLKIPLLVSRRINLFPQGSFTITHFPMGISKGPAIIDPPALINSMSLNQVDNFLTMDFFFLL